MAISFIGSAEGSSSPNTDTTVDLSGISMAQNDLVIVAQAIGDNDNTALNLTMVSTGWTELFTDIDNTADDQDVYLGIWYKFMGATPDSSAVVDGLGGTDAASAAIAMVFRGVDTTTPFDVTTTTATGTNTMHPNPPSIDHLNPTGLWTVIVGASGHTIGGTGTYTFPTGYTTNAIDRGHDDTSDVTVGMGYKTTPADPEDPGVMTHSGTDSASYAWIAATMALRPSSSITYFQTLSSTQVAGASLTRISTYLRTLSQSSNTIGTFTKITTFARTLNSSIEGIGTLTAAKNILQTLSATATAVGTLTATVLQIITMTATATASAIISVSTTFIRTLSTTSTALATLTTIKTVIQELSAIVNALGDMTRRIGQIVKGAKSILNLTTSSIMTKINDKIYLE